MWYNNYMDKKEKEEKEEKEVKLKCASCGASLNFEDKKCSYCGTINPNYKPKETKEIKPPKQLGRQKGMFGGLFPNVFGDIFNNFDED